MDSFGSRLRWALDSWGNSDREFSRRMHRTGVRGGSYRTLLHYLKDGKEPTSSSWYENAANILGVSREWLQLHEGHPRPEHDPGAEYRAHRERIADDFPWFAEVASPLAKAALHDAAVAVMDSMVSLDNPSLEDVTQVSLALLAVSETFRGRFSLFIGPTIGNPELTRFYVSFFASIVALAEASHEPAPMDIFIPLFFGPEFLGESNPK